MEEYLAHNQKTYDLCAEKYKENIVVWKEPEEIANNFSKFLLDKNTKVLELGPGNGQLAKLLCDRGYDVSAIEFAEKMAKVAKETVPRANIIVDEFLKHDFENTRFAGIIGIDFIHLFTEEDALKILNKIADLIEPQGVVYLSTRLYSEENEGYFEKVDLGMEVTRYRKRFTEESIIKLVSKDFIVLNKIYRKKSENKTWIDLALNKK